MTLRIDLHVHSKFSSRPSQWILQKIGCPESFTEPLNLYKIARLRGMTHVTITDHNCIEGALEIAHLPNTFISEEITTYFPEDHCKVHILALNITEAQHKDIQHLRENIYELADFLLQDGIFHIVAHPLFSVNGRLAIEHLEKMLLIFKNFEMNGARNDVSNETLQRIVTSLLPADIDEMANRHGINPKIPRPWEKNITGGSDDHSSLNIARTFTQISGADSLEGALNSILDHKAEVIRRPSTPLTFAHNIYGIAYQYYKGKFDLERYAGSDTLLDFLDHCLQPDHPKNSQGLMAKLYGLWFYRKRPRLQVQVPETLGALIRHESGRLLYDNPQLLEIAKSGAADSRDLENKWFDFVNLTSNRMALNLARNLINHLSGANVFNTFQTIGEAGGLYAMVAPYLISFSFFSEDRVFCQSVIEHFKPGSRNDTRGKTVKDDRKIAHFTDRSLASKLPEADVKQSGSNSGHHSNSLITFTCRPPSKPTSSSIRFFQPVGTYENPEFPDRQLLFPPFMEMLEYAFSKHITHVHSATPGPVGIAAIGVARILKIPAYGTFHPSFKEFVPLACEDESADEVLQRYMSWYYDQLDRIYVYSRKDADHLIQHGVDKKRITLVPCAIDLGLFRPTRRYRQSEPEPRGRKSIRVLYAGPVTHSNNLWLLAEVFKVLNSQQQNLQFTVMGEGPYVSELEGQLKGYPYRYHRWVSPRERAKIIGTSSIFVCPGDDIGKGRSLMEAQACGLPLIITDKVKLPGFISHGKSGLVFKHNDANSLFEALHRLVSDPEMRERMAAASRRSAVSQAVDAAALRTSEDRRPPIPSTEDVRLARAV